MSCEYIFALSTGIWLEIDGPSSISVASISGRLVSSGFLGQLDTRINGCHTVVSGCIQPPLNIEEQAIYEYMYLAGYYKKRSLQSFGSASPDNPMAGIEWTRIQENDSVVSRANPNEIAKFWRTLYNDANIEVNRLVDLYKRNRSAASSVDYITINQYGGNGVDGGSRNYPSS